MRACLTLRETRAARNIGRDDIGCRSVLIFRNRSQVKDATAVGHRSKRTKLTQRGGSGLIQRSMMSCTSIPLPCEIKFASSSVWNGR